MKSAAPAPQTGSTEHKKHLPAMVRYYASTATKYNEWHADLSIDESHNFAVARLLELLKKNGHKTVLDVCCGTGRAMKACLEAGFDARGVDVSQELINEGIKQWGLPKDRFTCADATKLPFPDGHFDASCILGALHHCAIPENIVSEMLRVTRHMVVISDCGNRLSGGIKKVLLKLGLFNIVYRVIFRRPPRKGRRAITSDGDGHAFIFSVDEVMDMVKAEFPRVETHNFYFRGRVRAPFLPKLFATHVVLIASR